MPPVRFAHFDGLVEAPDRLGPHVRLRGAHRVARRVGRLTHPARPRSGRARVSSKPNMAKLFFMCSGSGAVTSMTPLARMGQDQAARQKMQLGFEPGRNGAQTDRSRAGSFGGPSVVFRIADDRMADRLAMGAQLMGAAGDRAHRQPREARRDLVDDRIEGERMLRVGIAVLGDPHPLEVRPALPARLPHALALGEKHRDAPLRRLRHALDQRPIDLLRPARAEDLAKLRRHLARFGDQQHARRVAVEPMNENGPIAFLVGERLKHAVDMARGPRAALDREAVGLVEHHHVAILEQDHRADRFGVAGIGALDG